MYYPKTNHLPQLQQAELQQLQIMSTTTTRARKRGRPSKLTPELSKELSESISDGLPLTHAAALAGVSYETFCEWRRKFPDFRHSIELAISRGVASRLKTIRKASDAGDLSASKWWLEHVQPEHFGKNRVDVSMKHEGAIEQRFSFDAAILKQLAEVRKEYERV